MIAVKLKEHTRTFSLFVGEKKVGRVVVYHNNRCSAYARTPEGDEKFLESFDTLKQATDRILRYDDFGKCISVDVRRTLGGIKG